MNPAANRRRPVWSEEIVPLERIARSRITVCGATYRIRGRAQRFSTPSMVGEIGSRAIVKAKPSASVEWHPAPAREKNLGDQWSG